MVDSKRSVSPTESPLQGSSSVAPILGWVTIVPREPVLAGDVEVLVDHRDALLPDRLEVGRGDDQRVGRGGSGREPERHRGATHAPQDGNQRH